ncbi:hypothetical protein [Flavivirga rizhaonensis]|uniref:hypothetical protein n=1 Tax=Flavivirga rizhaonensis TaxID=2559571 RepID=UPI00268E3AB6
METATKLNNIRSKVIRIKGLRGMKQEILVERLGVSQQSISILEQSETIEDEKLEQSPQALG